MKIRSIRAFPSRAAAIRIPLFGSGLKWVWGVLAGLALLLLPHAGKTQETPLVKNHLPEAMQAGNQNWSVAQAPSRHIYAGNTAGLLQFDGARWKLRALPDRQIVRTVAADTRGNVFCGGFGEFGFWRPGRYGIPEYISLSDSLKTEKAAREEIWHILVTENSVYFQSFSALYRYNYRSIKELSLPGNVMFMQEVRGKILLPVIGQGIFIQAPDERFVLLPGTEALGENIVAGLAPLPGGKLLIGTDRQGLFLWHNNELKHWDAPIQKALSKSRLNKMLLLSNGNIAFGSVGEGLFISNAAGHPLYHVHRGRGLQNNTVLALYEDFDGNLWVGLDKGLDMLALNSPLRFSLDRSGNLGAVFAACKFNNALYLGTNQGLFFKSVSPVPESPEASTWKPVPGIKGQVWDLSLVGEQLFCGHNDGTFLIKEGKASKISEVTGGWITRNCPWDSTLLVQGTYTGLVTFQKNGSRGLDFSHRIAGFDEPVEYMAFDSTGRLWAAHPYRGLHRLHLSKDLRHVTAIQKMTPADGLPTDFDLSLAEINGRLILHAGERYFQWQETGQRWTPYPAVNGYTFTGEEQALLPAGPEAYFAVYRDKVLRVSPQQNERFNLRLVNDRPNIVPLDSQTWLLCLEDGYALLDKERWAASPINTYPPQITEVDVMGNGVSYSIGSVTGDPATNALAELKPYENHLVFHFSSLVFDQKPVYRWRMQGLSEQWSDWQESAVQDFSFLPQGFYRFEVQSDQSEQIAVFEFRIMPRWYQTWYFKLLYVLLAMAAGVGVLYQHRRRLEIRHRKLMIERERKLHQQRIQERNEQLQEDILKKAKDLANSTMHLIRKNEVLLEIRQRLAKLKHDARVGLHVQQLNHLVEQELSSENDWAVFEENFNSVHEAFLRKMKHAFPELTPGDLRLAAYLKMNLSSKEIAPLLGISIRGVENKRYRLRRKMDLPNDENLVEFLLDF